MGLKTPRPEGDEPKTLTFEGISRTGEAPAVYPEDINGTFAIEQYEPGKYKGESGSGWGLLQFSLIQVTGGWKIQMLVSENLDWGFLDTKPTQTETFENDLNETFYYTGGTCTVGFGESDVNQAASDAGMPLGDKVFYEPMPKAVGHKSYRFAYQADHSRIYIRKQL